MNNCNCQCQCKNTFQGWKTKGRYVRQGEHGELNDDGNYIFSKDQTEELEPDSFISDWATIHGY